MTNDVSVTGCVSQVPYPTEANFDPTQPGVCAEFEALLRPEAEDGQLEEGDDGKPPIVAAMQATFRGDEDASIYDRLFSTGMPKLKGTHRDTITDLPITLQGGITTVSDVISAAIKGVQTYKVGVQRVVLVCVRSFYFVTLCVLCMCVCAFVLFCFMSV